MADGGHRTIDAGAEVDRAVQRHGHVAAFGLQHRDRRLAAELNVAERREGPAQQLAEAAALHDEEHEHGQHQTQQHCPEQKRQARVDGLFRIDLLEVLGRAHAQGAADRGRQLLVAEIEPVDDAVLGVGQALLQLPGRIVGIHASPEAQADLRQQIARHSEVEDERAEPSRRG